MKNERSIKIVAIIALCFAILGISISFAVLSSTLEIKGVATIKEESWDITFANMSSKISNGAVQNIVPTLNATYIGDFDITLGNGDSITYTFDVVNNGTMDAKIGTITVASFLCNGTAINPSDKLNDETLACNNIQYQLTYENDSNLQIGDTLLVGETKKMKLKISYNGALPMNSVRISNLNVAFIYVQN